MGAEQLGQALSMRIELDPCISHQDLYGQLITEKVQHRRYFTITLLSFLFCLTSPQIHIHHSQSFICCPNSPQILMLKPGTVPLQATHQLGIAFTLSNSMYCEHFQSKLWQLSSQRAWCWLSRRWPPGGWTSPSALTGRTSALSSGFTP